MTILRKGTFPFRPATLKRNVELRAVLKHLDAYPEQSMTQIASHLGEPRSKIRNAIENLAHSELVYVSRSGLSAFNTAVHFYSASIYGADDLDRLLPIVAPEGHSIRAKEFTTPAKSPKPDTRQAYRDPLFAALYGQGRAPSLNFMDSNRGANDAQSQTTTGPN